MGWPVSCKLPKTCECGSRTGTITADKVVCACGAVRVNMSPITTRFLESFAEHFGEPTETIFRKSALEKIRQQDEFLKRRRRSDGVSWFDIITDNLDCTGPLGTEPGNDLHCAEESSNENE
jgi:hypothetical protein